MQTGVTRRRLSAPGVAEPPFSGALAVQAGDMIFLGGIMATDWQTGIRPADQPNPDFPFARKPIQRQAHGIFQTLQALLQSAGSSLDQMTRIDQFPTNWDYTRYYLPIRDEYIPTDRPASTCVAIRELLVKDAHLQVDGIAIVPRDGFTKIAIDSDKAPKPRGGYSLAIRAGDWIWCAGASPTDFKSRAAYPGGLGHTQPEHVLVDPNFWYGQEIRNQTAYDLYKLALYLEAAGSDLQHVVKAHVYLTDASDLPGFTEVWQETFGDNPPATTVVPIDRMGIGGSRVEISMIALAKDSAVERVVINPPTVPTTHLHAPAAIKAGPYLFLSGRQAALDDRIDPRAKPNPAMPHLTSRGHGEMTAILEQVDAICRAAGGRLQDAARVQLFTTEMGEIAPALIAWSQAFGDEYPALTVVGSTGPHIIPSLALAADVIAYIP